MEFGKQYGSWDSNSSDECEPQDPTKRPYECTFCKRGFTNAQALGGHMNIHRKDRAKAKHKHPPNFLPSSSSQYSNHQTHPNAPTQPPAAVYYPPPPPSYRMYFDTEADMAGSFPVHREGLQSVNEELLGANLSLQIDQSRGVWNHEEVDLELRLGHEYR